MCYSCFLIFVFFNNLCHQVSIKIYIYTATATTCSTCNKTVNHINSILCAQCFKPIHFKYNSLNFVDGQLMKNSNSGWFYLLCSNNTFPFTNFTNKKLQPVCNNEKYSVNHDINNSTKTFY